MCRSGIRRKTSQRNAEGEAALVEPATVDLEFWHLAIERSQTLEGKAEEGEAWEEEQCAHSQSIQNQPPAVA